MITDFSLSNIDCHVYCEGIPHVVFYWGTAKGHTDMAKVIELIKEAGGKDYLLYYIIRYDSKSYGEKSIRSFNFYAEISF